MIGFKRLFCSMVSMCLIGPLVPRVHAQEAPLGFSSGQDAVAARSQKRKRQRRRRRSKPRKVVIPANVGVGPAASFFTGPVGDDQIVHGGLRIAIFGVVDRKTRMANRDRIPSKYRKASAQAGEMRISPSILIPSSLWISPGVRNTGVYGITWRPIGFNVPLSSSSVRLDFGAGLLLSYAYVHSDSLPSPTHFLRPGADLKAEIEIPLSESFLVSLGWASQFYPPQEVGGSIIELGDLDTSIWHIGQAFLQFHVRFPYATRI
jgi:hypothetical protein